MIKSIFSKLSPVDIGLSLIPIIFFFISIIGEQYISTRFYYAFFAVGSFSFLILTIVINRMIRIPGAVTWLFLLFLLWAGVTTIKSQVIDQSIWELLRITYFIALFLGTFNLLRDKPLLQRFMLTTFAILASLLVVKDLIYYFLDGQFAIKQNFSGSLSWHNQMAGFLLFFIPILASITMVAKNLYGKIFVLFLLIISLFSLLLTYSRGGWLSLLLAVIIFVVFLRTKIKKTHIISITIFIVVGVIAALSFSPLTQKIESISKELFSESRTTSGNLRVSVWKNAISIIPYHPIFGIGPGAFGEIHHLYQKEPWLYAKNVHNHYLEFAVEMGIIGMMLFLSIIFATLYLIVKNRKRISDDNKYPLLTGIMVVFLASLIHVLLDVDWSRIPLFSIFWFMLAIIFADLVKKDKKIHTYGIKKLFYIPFLVLLVISIAMLFGEIKYNKAQEFNENNDLPQAQASIQDAQKMNPWDLRYKFLHANILVNQQKIKESNKIYESILQQTPSNIDAYYNLGENEFSKSNFKSAYSYFHKAIELGPYYNPRVYNYLSDTAKILKKDEESKKVLETAINEAFPLNKPYFDNEYIYEYARLKEELANTYLRLAGIYLKQNQKQKARKLVEIVMAELDPKNPHIPLFKKALR